MSGSLYEVLNVAKNATQEEVKKAYRRLAMVVHPDKCPGDQEAVAKFQSLQKVYTILGDPERRKVYDQTGETDEDLMGKSFTEVYDYFRAVFKKVTEEDVDDFHDAYRGSKEERDDLLKHYSKFQGDMGQVFEWLMCSDASTDSHRFMDIIQAAIDAGGAKKYKKFVSWAKEVQQRPRPKDPLATKSRRRGGGSGQLALSGSSSSKAMRAQQADAFFDQLAEKYSSKPGGPKRKACNEPTDEEFAAIQQRMGLRMSGEGQRESKAGKETGKGRKGGAKEGKQQEDETEAMGMKPDSNKKARGGKKSRRSS